MLMASREDIRPLLVLNPPDDREFLAFATAALNGGVGDPTILQSRLRDRYPAAIVRPRELAGEQTQVWYVYRDGHWTRTEGLPAH